MRFKLRVVLSLAILLLPATVLSAQIPAEDPVVEGPAPTIVEGLAGVHPRLLFGQQDVAALRAFVQTQRGQQFLTPFNGYLPVCYVPSNTSFLTNGTDAQREGLWKLPTVAMNYLLTGSQTSFNRTVDFMQFLMNLEHWETTSETDCGMGAANIMIGAALAFDWLYDDLDPTFREQYRQKLWEQARRMYYMGHLKMAGTTGYWVSDPQNNHRWHRDAGLALCVLAAATGDDSEKWMMTKLAEELAFVANWLPDDGTTHESPGYMIFGASHLVLAMQASDRCLGTEHLQKPFFQNFNRYMVQMMSPGLNRWFAYGDQGGINVGSLGYDVSKLKTAGLHEKSDAISVIDAQIDSYGVANTTAWLGMIWYPTALPKGSLANIPDHDFLPDMGLQLLRDGWDSGSVAAMFKCSPFGGYALNRYRVEYGYTYVNVAHDDPDANSFVILRDGRYLAETSRYSYSKKSANHNTLLVNGLGQVARGRTEGVQWTQPATHSNSMYDIAVVTARGRTGRNVAVEGEAADSYPAYSSGELSRPALTRYRRIFAYVEGKYILTLDDMRAPQTVDFNWLMQGPNLDALSAAEGRYRLRNGDTNAEFQAVSDRALSPQLVTSPADNRNTNLGWQQLRLTANASTARIAAVFDAWNRGNLRVTMQTIDATSALVTVSGPQFKDTWTWRAGEGKFDPSTLVGRSQAGEIILVMNQAEPLTRELMAAIAPLHSSPVAGGWSAVVTTAGDEVELPLVDNQIAARLRGPRRFRISFSAPLDASTVDNAAVSIIGRTGGNQAGLISSVELADQRTLVVNLSQPLPDTDWYTITVNPGVLGANGSALSGKLSLRLGTLAGDVDASGKVDVADMMIVRSLVGLGVRAEKTIPAQLDGETVGRADVDGSGGVTGADLLLVRRLMGTMLP